MNLPPDRIPDRASRIDCDLLTHAHEGPYWRLIGLLYPRSKTKGADLCDAVHDRNSFVTRCSNAALESVAETRGTEGRRWARPFTVTYITLTTRSRKPNALAIDTPCRHDPPPPVELGKSDPDRQIGGSTGHQGPWTGAWRSRSRRWLRSRNVFERGESRFRGKPSSRASSTLCENRHKATGGHDLRVERRAVEIDYRSSGTGRAQRICLSRAKHASVTERRGEYGILSQGNIGNFVDELRGPVPCRPKTFLLCNGQPEAARARRSWAISSQTTTANVSLGERGWRDFFHSRIFNSRNEREISPCRTRWTDQRACGSLHRRMVQKQPIHVSGHPCRGTNCKKMYQWCGREMPCRCTATAATYMAARRHAQSRCKIPQAAIRAAK